MSAGEQRPNRRAMCRDALRWGAAGGIAAFSSLLLFRSAGPNADDRCGRPLACGDCAALAKCGFPAAEAARKINDEREH